MATGIKSKKGKIRADLALLERGLAATLEEAKAIIMAGDVLAADQRGSKPSDLVTPETPLRIKSDDRSHYVSRGGDKIAAASAELGIEGIFRGATVIDVGSSTGGFTDYCLKSGAEHVIAVDVGHNQLAWELRKDPRVTLFESTHIKYLVEESNSAQKSHLVARAGIMVADISFNSICRLLPEMLGAGPGVRHYLILVKPQFELEAAMIPKGGVVTNARHRKFAVENVDAAFKLAGFPGGRWVDSSVPGKSGNIEIFYYNHSQN